MRPKVLPALSLMLLSVGFEALGNEDERPVRTVPFEIPKLAPGTYLACLGTAEKLAAALAAGDPAVVSGVSCRGGFLAVGGELSLRLGAPPR